MAYTEDEGVQAIIDLQAAVGLTEPEDRARAEWRKFSEHDKKQTELAHKAVCGGHKTAPIN